MSIGHRILEGMVGTEKILSCPTRLFHSLWIALINMVSLVTAPEAVTGPGYWDLEEQSRLDKGYHICIEPGIRVSMEYLTVDSRSRTWSVSMDSWPGCVSLSLRGLGGADAQVEPQWYRAQSSVEDRTRMLMNQLGSWSLKLPQWRQLPSGPETLGLGGWPGWWWVSRDDIMNLVQGLAHSDLSPACTWFVISTSLVFMDKCYFN